MYRPQCPYCQQRLEPAQMNLEEGVAVCASCNTTTPLVKLAKTDEKSNNPWIYPDNQQIHIVVEGLWRDMPTGCKVTGSPDDLTLTATTRSMGKAMTLSLFALIWNGMVCLFVLMALIGLYQHFAGPLPVWMENNELLGEGFGSLRDCVISLVIMVPFSLAEAAFWALALVYLDGDVRLHLKDGVARVSTGFRWLRITRRINVSDVRGAYLGLSWWRYERNRKPVIMIKTSKRLKFGLLLSPKRIRWFASAVQMLLLGRDRDDASEHVKTLLALEYRPLGFWVQPED